MTVPNSDLHLKAVFTHNPTTAVGDIAVDQAQSTPLLKIEGHTIHFSSITTAQTIDVYDVCGQLIRHIEPSGDSCSVQIPVNGLYIIKIGNKTYKVWIVE